MLRVLRLAGGDLAAIGPRIAALERGVTYPLGNDRFEIDHGADYFAFFRRLGSLRYYAAFEGDRLAGVLAAVLRAVQGPAGDPRRAWYLCDLKADRRHAGVAVARPLLDAFAEDALRELDEAYAVSMDPPDGINRIARLLHRLLPDPPRPAARLRLFSLDRDAMRRAAAILAGDEGPPTYRSLAGIKDIVLQSTGRPMPLLHVQRGPLRREGNADPEAGAVHMFCLPEQDPRMQTLRAMGLQPSASATVLARGLQGVDFGFVLTSDI